MTSQTNKKPYKKIALVLSLCAMVVWGILGTGASLAWFTDTSEEINNIFHFANFELKVSHQLTDGSWEKVDSQTKIFNEEALYEPGYVQVVYLKVENLGDVEFQLKTAVQVNGFTLGNNIFGNQFNLQDHLKFGLCDADTLDGVKAMVANREMAKQVATMDLQNYAQDMPNLNAGGTTYIALVLYMPEEEDNVANYRDYYDPATGELKSGAPKVELGIIIKAEQIHN